MTVRENKAIATRVFDEIWSRGQLDLADALLASDFVGRPGGLAEPFQGPEGAKEFIGRLREGFPDITFEVHDLIGEGNVVAARWVATGTHDGEFMGTEATGRPVQFGGMTVLHFDDGMIHDGWTELDALTMLRQIGLVPDRVRT